MTKITKFILMTAFVLAFSAITYAQTVELSGQFRPRYEMRNGFSTLIPEGTQPANFISQRTRLNFKFSNDIFKVGFAVQNIGVWGETGTMSRSNTNGTMIHEAWGQVKLHEKFFLKVGRQQIVYDDQRIFGGVDWAQQARRHDAAILMIKPKDDCQVDVGIAYNALAESAFKQYYTINNYKAFQYIHWNRKFNAFKVSILFLNNGLAYQNFSDTTSSGIVKEKIAYSQTFGARGSYGKEKIKANAAFYYQTGKISVDTNSNGINESTKKVSGIYFGADASFQLTDLFNLGLGFEFLSGNSMKDPGDKDQAFKPLYGTNHKFNGFMDYFYVGNHMNSVGLVDIYIPLKFKKDKFSAAFIPHLFMSGAEVYGFNSEGEEVNSGNLGTEFDLVFGYAVAKSVKISAGYSQMLATESMQVVKGEYNPKGSQNWAWVMIDIKPTFFKSKSK